MIKQIQYFLLLLILAGCRRTFDVEKDEAAIVISPLSTYENKVFKEGNYRVGSNNAVIFYDIRTKEIHFAFDFILGDATSGHIEFLLTYTPDADSIYNFYKQYQIEHVDLVVEVEVKAMLRVLMKKFSRDEVSVDEIRERIMLSMNGDQKILDYIIIENISGLEISLD